ncbi:MAG: hypothetical protein KDD35_01375, partial [Bdellovibrionales bacterium]|nr:hypothetical protein [Bdellovibrionales bacterium]
NILKDVDKTDMVVENRLLNKGKECPSNIDDKKGFLKSKSVVLSNKCDSRKICIGEYDKSISKLKSLQCNENGSVLNYRDNHFDFSFDYWPNGQMKRINFPGNFGPILYLESNFGKAAKDSTWPEDGGTQSMKLPHWVRDGSPSKDVAKGVLEISENGRPTRVKLYGKNGTENLVPITHKTIKSVSDLSYGNLIEYMPLARLCCKRDVCRNSFTREPDREGRAPTEGEQ